MTRRKELNFIRFVYFSTVIVRERTAWHSFDEFTLFLARDGRGTWRRPSKSWPATEPFVFRSNIEKGLGAQKRIHIAGRVLVCMHYSYKMRVIRSQIRSGGYLPGRDVYEFGKSSHVSALDWWDIGRRHMGCPKCGVGCVSGMHQTLSRCHQPHPPRIPGTPCDPFPMSRPSWASALDLMFSYTHRTTHWPYACITPVVFIFTFIVWVEWNASRIDAHEYWCTTNLFFRFKNRFAVKPQQWLWWQNANAGF